MRGFSLRLSHAFVLIVVLALLDQLVKAVVERSMALGEMIPVLPFLALLRAHNEGVAFSMLAGFDFQFIVALTAVISAGAIYMLVRTPAADWPSRLGLALIIGGAAGNLMDRVQHAYVVDYIFFHTPVWSFAIFNLADVFITCGAGLVIVDELLLKGRRDKAQN
ncbi:MAG: signal peptidase II [Phyllobacteriaceae bacterium]|nr:signal peptidase II [Phyllobacteriaceae bacterium]